jgi:hypothetical protein
MLVREVENEMYMGNNRDIRLGYCSLLVYNNIDLP